MASCDCISPALLTCRNTAALSVQSSAIGAVFFTFLVKAFALAIYRFSLRFPSIFALVLRVLGVALKLSRSIAFAISCQIRFTAIAATPFVQKSNSSSLLNLTALSWKCSCNFVGHLRMNFDNNSRIASRHSALWPVLLALPPLHVVKVAYALLSAYSTPKLQLQRIASRGTFIRDPFQDLIHSRHF